MCKARIFEVIICPFFSETMSDNSDDAVCYLKKADTLNRKTTLSLQNRDSLMILQNIVFPRYGICSISDLYFRLKNEVDYSFFNQSINLNGGKATYFDTYFNGLYLKNGRNTRIWVK